MPSDGKSKILTLHLLDSAKGQVVQTWRFEGCSRLVIGRAPESDIRLTDKSVSRVHVEFTLNDEGTGWVLTSHGRNGTLIAGEMVDVVTPKDRTIFQLGPSGPRFQLSLLQENAALQATVTSDTDPGTLDFLTIDLNRKTEEVQRIAEADSFRLLIERARELRQNRSSNVGQ